MDTAITLPVQEVEKTTKQTTLIQEQANSLTIKSPEDVETAVAFLEQVKEAEKIVTTRKEEITRPLMRSLASVRDLFKPWELAFDESKKVVKAKIVQYQAVEEQRIAEERSRIEKRVEKGTMRVDTAVSKLESVGEVPKTVGKMQTRVITKVRVFDETLIPREFLVPNLPKITEVVLRQGMSVPGVEKYQEKIIAV